MKRSSRVVLRVLGGLVGLVFLLAVVLAVWGLIEPRFLDRTEETATVANLPPPWEGEQIAVIADLQIGLFGDNESTVTKAVEEIVATEPAAALIAGDFLYKPRQDTQAKIDRVVELVRPLTEHGIVTYAVFGNHDYGIVHSPSSSSHATELTDVFEPARMLEAELEQAGIEVLHNEVVTLEHPTADAPLHLVGLGSLWAGKFAPEQAFAKLPAAAPRIVMMHNPEGFPQLLADQASFTVAGHTHGGQVRIPWTPEWTWLSYTGSGTVHADGWVAEDFGAEGNRMYVNRGIGMSVVPIRINAMPEVTFFRLEPVRDGVELALARR